MTVECITDPLIIGAGPAGLTAALELVKRGITPRIFEASEHVGGLARTPGEGPWRIDAGGHRFFTKSEEISDLWRSLLPADEWIAVPRRSAMLVDGHYVHYPLRGRDLMWQLGAGKGLRGLASLLWARMRTGSHIADGSASFREWGTYEFGRYWYETFFDGYVRKTWVIDPDNIASDWANQRIKPISWDHRKHDDPATADVFRYPRRGPGQLWEAAAAQLRANGVAPQMNSRVVRVRSVDNVCSLELANGDVIVGDAVFCSGPLRHLIEALDPAPPQYIKAIAATLKHRSLITVAVALREHPHIPFNWVYTPGKEFTAGRIQNYLRWSKDLAPAGWAGKFLGFEYFIGPGGELWSASDEELTSIVESDLRALGCGDCTIEKVMIVRSQYAYPIHDATRDRNVARVRDYLSQHYPALHLMGRNGMHRYDNQDHAMLSAIQSVAQCLGSTVDPWQVNTDRLYHESGLFTEHRSRLNGP